MPRITCKLDKNNRIALPKQWIHWAKKAGLKPNGGLRPRGLRDAYEAINAFVLELKVEAMMYLEHGHKPQLRK